MKHLRELHCSVEEKRDTVVAYQPVYGSVYKTVAVHHKWDTITVMYATAVIDDLSVRKAVYRACGKDFYKLFKFYNTGKYDAEFEY